MASAFELILQKLLSDKSLKIASVLADLGEIYMLWNTRHSPNATAVANDLPPNMNQGLKAAFEVVRKYSQVRESDALDDIIFGGMVGTLFSDLPEAEAGIIKAKITGFLQYLNHPSRKMAGRLRYNLFRLGNEEAGGLDAVRIALRDIANEPDDASRHGLVEGRGWLAGAGMSMQARMERIQGLAHLAAQAWAGELMPMFVSTFSTIGQVLDHNAYGAGATAQNPTPESFVGELRGFSTRLKARTDQRRALLNQQPSPAQTNAAGGTTGNNNTNNNP